MHIREEFALRDLAVARQIVHDHPFATLVTAGLRATHMPCLLEEGSSGLAVVGHVARADPAASTLDGPMLAIFHGPHGYISASWYADESIPTWNYVMLHLHGTPELLPDAMPVLERTVDFFEAAVEHPRSLAQAGDTARELATQVIAFRLEPESWHLEAKLSQDKPADDRARLLAALEDGRAYANPPLAQAMRRLGP